MGRSPGVFAGARVKQCRGRADVEGMISHGGVVGPDENAQGPNARRGGRLRVCGVTSDLGPVADLSASGMRVKVKGKPRLHEQLIVQVSAGGQPVTLAARIVWMKRAGLWRHEIGLEFVDMTEDQQRQIRELVRTGMATVGLARDAA